MVIIEDDLSGSAVADLLNQHLAGMARHSPHESIHALDISGLNQPNITFWTAWRDNDLLGCAALKELTWRHGEIKSMRTAAKFLGQGVGSALLQHLMGESRRRRYSQLYLETGSGPAFVPAHNLYQKYGFNYCGPFGDYRPDPFSRFMTLEFS